MNELFSGYKPASLFQYFADLAAIPHGSGNEEATADYLENFAKERGLFCYRDALDNVLIRRPASAGYESRPTVLIQGHTDMVCEKNGDVTHDFLTDPLDLYVEDGWLRARGTTLGADDGAAVAAMLELLSNDDYAHPELECLFTTGEEVGLVGASGFDYTQIRARRMLNLDTEGEGIAIAGCAGGQITTVCADTDTAAPLAHTLKVAVRGLMGGHSGADIHLGRKNANKVMASVLYPLCGKLRLVSIEGGCKDNAIPRECTAVITTDDPEAVRKAASDAEAAIRPTLADDDRAFVITVTEESAPQSALSDALTASLLGHLYDAPYGVVAMSRELEGIVETSVNLGVIRMEAGKVEITYSVRSSVPGGIEGVASAIEKDAAARTFSVEHSGRYPGWPYKADSALADTYLRVFEETFGRVPEVTVIHAGLECGIVKENIPDMDILAIGPDIMHIHTPNEAMSLASFARFWVLLKALLAE